MRWIRMCSQLICSLEKKKDELRVQCYFHVREGSLTIV